MQLRHRHDGARGPVRAELLRVDGVEGRPTLDVGDIYGRLEDEVGCAARLLEDRDYVVDRAARLLVESREAALGLSGHDGKLARDVDQAVVDHRLRVMAARGGCGQR